MYNYNNGMPDTYRASTLKNEAAALMRDSLPFKLLDAKAALTAFAPENAYSRHIPKPYAAMGISNLMRGLGWTGGLAALTGLGYMGYKWNKKIAEKSLADKLEEVGRLRELANPMSVEKYACFNGASMEKQASTAREEVRSIMHRIYEEDPSYWPYGLDIPGHDSVYLIRDNMTKQAAGFVGWQVLHEGKKKIGSYSIGILPEYRNNGFAKEAVAKVLQKKASQVDEVRSYVCSHNKRSKGLANSLNITIQTEF